MVQLGHFQIWNGPVVPWWWPRILLLENRLEDLRKSAAYDPDKLEPPRDLWALNRKADLESWLESRSKERERRLKEQKPIE